LVKVAPNPQPLGKVAPNPQPLGKVAPNPLGKVAPKPQPLGKVAPNPLGKSINVVLRYFFQKYFCDTFSKSIFAILFPKVFLLYFFQKYFWLNLSQRLYLDGSNRRNGSIVSRIHIHWNNSGLSYLIYFYGRLSLCLRQRLLRRINLRGCCWN
jgi:hypothetical protein